MNERIALTLVGLVGGWMGGGGIGGWRRMIRLK